MNPLEPEPALARCARLMGTAPPQRTADIEVSTAPPCVERHEVARAGADYLVLLAPAPERAPDAGRWLAQVVLAAPPGRYVSDAFDVERRAWVARETAASPPLVLGVPAAAGAVVLRLRRL